MICHMKHIFMWIFLIPQPTGIIFIWDCVLTFACLLSSFVLELDRFILQCTLLRRFLY